MVPVDVQEASLEALAVTRDLGKRLGLGVVLLHVYSVAIPIYPGVDQIIAPVLPEEVAAAAKQALDQLARSSGDLRAILRAGEPAAEVLKVIEEIKPAMVVLGTHGRKGVARPSLGSVAEKVVRMSPVQVITVHARAS